MRNQVETRWKLLTNKDIPAKVKNWRLRKIMAALRLITAGLAVWSHEQNRLLIQLNASDVGNEEFAAILVVNDLD